MAKPFKGKINVDIRDSVPGLGAVRAADGTGGRGERRLHRARRRRVLGAGLLRRPDRDAEHRPRRRRGLRYTQFHTTALCSPTRSCLLTGRNHTRNSMACITEAAIGFPNASGVIPPENGQIQEILGSQGWNTYMVGKWHLCPDAEMNLASPRRNWPTGRGFERFYGFLGAETNQWYPDLVHDSHPVDPPRTPGEGYHLTEDLTDKALEFIRDAKAIAPEKPFFLYYAPGACHAPHHAPKEWIERFKGQFDMGYEAMREQTLARQKEMGIVPPDTELPPLNPIGVPGQRTGPNGEPFPALDFTRPWDALSAEEQRLFCRMAEVYAGFMGHADEQIGRLLDYLEESGQRENTMVVVVSDNGASGEGGPNGSVNENKIFNGIPDDIEREPRDARRPRRPEDLQPLPQRLGDGLQHAVQDVEALRVQRRHVGPVHHLVARGRHRRRRDPRAVPPRHRPRPDDPRRGRRRGARDDRRPRADPVRRRQHALQLRARHPAQRPVDAVLRDARLARDLARGLEGRHHAPDAQRLGALRRRHVGALPHRGRPLRGARPRRAGARAPAGDDQPLVRRGGRQRRVPARRPLARSRSSSRPGRCSRRRATATSTTRALAEVPESQAVNVRNRSFAIGALVDIPEPGAQGVLFAQGARFGGHALYVKDNRLHYVYNFVGSVEQHVVADADLPTGEDLILSAAFEKKGEDPPGVAAGILTLYHGDVKVGEGPHQDPAGQVLARRRGALRRARRRRAGHRRLPRRRARGRSPAARSSASPSTSAASRTSTSSARPRR